MAAMALACDDDEDNADDGGDHKMVDNGAMYGNDLAFQPGSNGQLTISQRRGAESERQRC